MLLVCGETESTQYGQDLRQCFKAPHIRQQKTKELVSYISKIGGAASALVMTLPAVRRIEIAFQRPCYCQSVVLLKLQEKRLIANTLHPNAREMQVMHCRSHTCHLTRGRCMQPVCLNVSCRLAANNLMQCRSSSSSYCTYYYPWSILLLVPSSSMESDRVSASIRQGNP